MVATSLSFHLYTLFLFTKSDLKTLIPPVTLFAAAAAPSCSLSRLLHTVLWLWIHTLQLGLANQTLPHAIAEDRMNHPDRPLPAGRITVRQARKLRWMMVPLCLLLSAAYGPRTLLTGFGVALFMLAYNECGGARGHWLIRNGLNAIGYALAEAGATLVTCQSESEADGTVWISVALSAGIILTTIHAQDYKDIQGDIAAGRVTLPIAHPILSRAVTALLLIAWSWGISRTWGLDDATTIIMGALSLIVGTSFVARTDSRADKISFYWYNVWLGTTHVLLGYYRLRLAL
ncbi:UbiA prenyltransferase family [Russula emetica]|nr:UbiA prenyltransferase family [Russula emetica]